MTGAFNFAVVPLAPVGSVCAAPNRELEGSRERGNYSSADVWARATGKPLTPRDTESRRI